jgi:hypothetical protein
MSDDDASLRALQERVAAAAPAQPSPEHVDAAALVRMRNGDEDESLDDAYRHLASCAVCRARLTDEERGRELVEATFSPAPAPIPIRKPVRTRTLGWALAAAAALGLVAILLWRTPRHEAPLVITQRSFVGTMGTSSTPSPLPAADRNVELTLEGDAEAAVVVVCDATGARIFPAQTFARDARGKLVVVLAPRLFGPLRDPSNEARAWVFAGGGAAVQRVLQAVGADPVFDEARVRSITDENDVRLSIVPLAR